MNVRRVSVATRRLLYTARKNYYDLLDVPTNASAAEIKDAFYKQSKKYHPDVSATNAQRFVDIKEAYDVLKEDSRRSLYDRSFQIDPEFIIGRSYAKRPSSSGASSSSRERETFGGRATFINDPSRRFGHFYDPNSIFAGLMYKWRLGTASARFAYNHARFLSTSTSSKSYYEVLGVSKTASTSEIKTAFFALSKKYHPDQTGADATKFLEIKEAYDTLKDKEKRLAYDEMFNYRPRQTRPPTGARSSTYDPPFSDFARGQQEQQQWQYRWESSRRPPDQQNTFDPRDFQRIWRQYQEHLRSRTSQQFEEDLKRARQQYYDDYTKRRVYRWESFAKEHDKQNPFKKVNINWRIINRIIMTYFIFFIGLAVFQAIITPPDFNGEPVDERRKSRRNAPIYTDDRDEHERIRQMMSTPPPSKRTSSARPPPDSTHPWG